MHRTLAHGVRAAATAFVATLGIAHAQNVCVIVLDDCGPELLGAYDQYFASIGKPSGVPANTPAIDQLIAQRGLMFTRAWSAPVCTPARAQMLTGRYPSRLGTGCVLEPRSVTPNPGLDIHNALLPQYLATAPTPYDRVALGKWHLGSHDQLLVTPAHPLGDPPGTWFARYAGPLFNLQKAIGTPPGVNIYQSWIKTYSAELFTGVNPCSEGSPPCETDVMGNPVQSYATVDTTNDALAVLPTLQEPWLLWVAYNGIHAPPHFVPGGLPTTSCGTYTAPTTQCDPGSTPTKASKTRCVLEALDSQIARLVCALDESDTTLILVGDNGTSKNVVMAPYPASHAKGQVYEAGVHVPLIVRSPLIPSNLVGHTCDAMVQTVDLFATICELAQVNPATTTGTDSVSMLPYFFGATTPQRTRAYAEIFVPNFVPQPFPGWLPPGYQATRHDQALRDDRFKLIRKTRRLHSGQIVVTEEFYDLQQGGPSNTPDWFEQNNLLNAPLSPQALLAYTTLQSEMLLQHPTVVQ